jgi:hypothetical protein
MALTRRYVAIARGTKASREIRDNLAYAKDKVARQYFASASRFLEGSCVIFHSVRGDECRTLLVKDFESKGSIIS